MDSSTQGISPLRQRMLDDMRLRKLSPKTQSHYVRAVRQFAGYLGRAPDSASAEDLRGYQLHLVDQGTSPVSLNAAITGLKFFFDITLDRAELMAKMQPVHLPRTLPVVLSRAEVGRLIAAAGNLKHQTALSVAYGAGLRAGEVVACRATASNLTDQVLPQLPVRQWDLAVPKRLRYFLRRDTDLQGAALRLLLRAVEQHLRAYSPGSGPAARLWLRNSSAC